MIKNLIRVEDASSPSTGKVFGFLQLYKLVMDLELCIYLPGMKLLGIFFSLICLLTWSCSATFDDSIDDVQQLNNVLDIKDSLRVQRDISCNVTINHYLWPAINLTSSYFGTNFSKMQLDSIDALLELGYMRLEFDIYWDSTYEIWELCPVEVSDKNSTEDQTINQFTCTIHSLEIFLGSINRYLVSTQVPKAPLKTNLVMLILHIHGTDNQSHPLTLLSEIISKTIISSTAYTSRIYTPNDFIYDQKNKPSNSTWWPQWIQLVERHFQLLVGFGEIQAEVNSSNKTMSNEGILFGAGTFGVPTYFENSTFVQDTCYKALENPLSEPPSWSLVDKKNQSLNSAEISQVIHCGQSPMLDISVSSTEYRDLLQKTIENTLWSWDEGQPPKDNKVACAAIQQSNGRWRVEDCSEQLNVACRHRNEPGKWVVANTTASYDQAFLVCPDNYLFDTPRTAWQNQQLFYTIQRDYIDPSTEEKSQDRAVWINLNSAISAQCWVVGQSDLCWWLNKAILILFGFFTWVKCARLWRLRRSNQRKRIAQHMLARRDYVTVPYNLLVRGPL
ncbi:hypothetical protein J3Q64DRAFT_1699648 [Phycomyces blakesleeanus]|uniref:Maintenance of telomere capping protein 6 n=2 Tax=Phycomyces blakesleeanus TaxID=4837 RepID=A0A167MB15_PHYB8|nr:hypothetical protein PHYBLDRAFT_187355 [Phycomyces blakesleeanus NRRL 1555(-)]OAD72329.1 hypothetical protein PHYBLDRAFT_187355 [Phycomyces blakesleeanus NRRL 1555(-)]|eukprot:XP_018290369.1 hypothetical protein PHYBLDRAFT_187355 [Phycomyces blakesleeanus NRRL 1555(-)]